jgi:hypothetical protein
VEWNEARGGGGGWEGRCAPRDICFFCLCVVGGGGVWFVASFFIFFFFFIFFK